MNNFFLRKNIRNEVLNNENLKKPLKYYKKNTKFNYTVFDENISLEINFVYMDMISLLEINSFNENYPTNRKFLHEKLSRYSITFNKTNLSDEEIISTYNIIDLFIREHPNVFVFVNKTPKLFNDSFFLGNIYKQHLSVFGYETYHICKDKYFHNFEQKQIEYRLECHCETIEEVENYFKRIIYKKRKARNKRWLREYRQKQYDFLILKELYLHYPQEVI